MPQKKAAAVKLKKAALILNKVLQWFHLRGETTPFFALQSFLPLPIFQI